MVGLVKGLVRGLEVNLRAFLVQGSRQKAVAERHALLGGVSGASVSCSLVMLYH
jgi:hypothetical protein